MQRLARIRQKMQIHGYDAALVMEPANRRYLTGFTGTSGYAIITSADAWFFTDSRYIQQAQEQCLGWKIINIGSSFTEAASERLKAGQLKSVAFEKDYVTYGDVERYRVWEKDVPGLSLMPSDDLVGQLRMVKDQNELNLIQAAADIADKTFDHMLGVLRPGITESEAALELEFTMRRLGASGPSFETIVASGWRSALPHGVASDKVLEVGDFVTMDFGAVYQGYVSDLTRTVCLGQPSDRQKEIYDIVLDAQLRSIDAVRAGISGKELDAVARDYIADHGFGDAFGHSLGHGIGLAIHEEPRVSYRSEEILQAGMVITIEPGIYLPGWGGIRIEDDVVVQESGKQVLTHAPKHLICL